jgi:hypothetical protein
MANSGGFHLPIGRPLRSAVLHGRPWKPVIREQDAVSDEDLILNRDTFAYEAVRRYLATRPDLCSGLNLDERTDPGFIADYAAIEVYEVWMEYPDFTPELNIFCNRHPNCSQNLIRYLTLTLGTIR